MAPFDLSALRGRVLESYLISDDLHDDTPQIAQDYIAGHIGEEELCIRQNMAKLLRIPDWKDCFGTEGSTLEIVKWLPHKTLMKSLLMYYIQNHIKDHTHSVRDPDMKRLWFTSRWLADHFCEEDVKEFSKEQWGIFQNAQRNRIHQGWAWITEMMKSDDCGWSAWKVRCFLTGKCFGYWRREGTSIEKSQEEGLEILGHVCLDQTFDLNI
ncbi:MAG: hypothetical protein AAGM67_15675, partial [Bacteroidota bacterium]